MKPIRRTYRRRVKQQEGENHATRRFIGQIRKLFARSQRISNPATQEWAEEVLHAVWRSCCPERYRPEVAKVRDQVVSLHARGWWFGASRRVEIVRLLVAAVLNGEARRELRGLPVEWPSLAEVRGRHSRPGRGSESEPTEMGTPEPILC